MCAWSWAVSPSEWAKWVKKQLLQSQKYWKDAKLESLDQNCLCAQTAVEINTLLEWFQLQGLLCPLFLHLEALTALSILKSWSAITWENILDFLCSNLNMRKSKVPLTAAIRRWCLSLVSAFSGSRELNFLLSLPILMLTARILQSEGWSWFILIQFGTTLQF